MMLHPILPNEILFDSISVSTQFNSSGTFHVLILPKYFFKL